MNFSYVCRKAVKLVVTESIQYSPYILSLYIHILTLSSITESSTGVKSVPSNQQDILTDSL